MSERNCHSNPFPTGEGTSRQQRRLESLIPSFVQVDERKIEDLHRFALAYSEEISFFNKDNLKDGDWVSFFEQKIDEEGYTEPHFALWMAFLRLFRIQQQELNKITQKHLDFYYRDVLKLQEKEPVPDQVFIIFKLAKHVHQHLVKKGTVLKAGKDDLGKDISYLLKRDLVANKAKIDKIKALYRDNDGRLYASPIANSADGLGAELEDSEKKWKTFGQNTISHPAADREKATIGFAISSPILLLKEGRREIILKINFERPNTVNFDKIFRIPIYQVFEVEFSGEESWIHPMDWVEEEDMDILESRVLHFLNHISSWEDIVGRHSGKGPVYDDPHTGYSAGPEGYEIGEITAKKILIARGEAGFKNIGEVRAVEGVGVDKINDLYYTFGRNPCAYLSEKPDGSIELVIRVKINREQEPIVGYNQEVLGERFETPHPIMKVLFVNGPDQSYYPALSQLKIKNADLNIYVRELKQLVLQNDNATLPIGKNILPFGNQPSIGSSLYIGNQEVFSKQLDDLQLHLTWHGLPESFNNHYDGYTPENTPPSRNNGDFKVDIDILNRKSWSSLASDETIFSSGSGTTNLLDSHTINLGGVDISPYKRDWDLEEFSSWNPDSRSGFLRLSLSGSDFGHKDFPLAYTKKAIEAAKPNVIVPSINFPKEPYTPELKSVSLDYESSVDLIGLESEPEQFFHIEAFGLVKRNIQGANLFPQYLNEGNLYLGISDFSPSQNLSILFKVAEGSANPEKKPLPVHWSYLSKNNWVPFDKFNILSDGTNGLLQSGIIQFAVPKNANDTNTILPDKLHWIKASVALDSDAISDLIGIYSQAVSAVFSDNQNDPEHYKNALTAETISKLKTGDPGIFKVQQPYSSFGGKAKEEKNLFYTRISERLRHKNRAVTRWDYEHLVLEEFPEVYKVKTLNHTKYTGDLNKYSALAPLHVTLVIVSNVRNKNAVDPLRPKTSLIRLLEISEFLKNINSPCIELHVVNPLYEEIKISTNVKFFPGFDNGFYGKQLEDDLKAFLSPWAFEEESDIEFGGRIHFSVILNFIEKRNYVDYVTCFDMYHIIKNPVTGEIKSKISVEEALASTGVSILGSVGKLGNYGDHEINVLETDDCECEDNEVRPQATIASTDDDGCCEGENTFEI